MFKKLLLIVLAVLIFSPVKVYADVHNRPVTTASISPTPTTLGTGLTFYSDPVTVTLNATADTGFSIANTYYKIDDGTQQNYTAPFTVAGSGKHKIEYWSIDNSGIEELNHEFNSFITGYQHASITTINQTGNTFNVLLHLDNIQPYLNYISTSNGGSNCNNDTTAAFQVYDATTGALVSSQTEAEGGHCFNADVDPSTGNQSLLFPPLQLPTGTYFVHYSGGNFDWITDNFSYTEQSPAHNNPTTSASLSPDPSSPGTGLSFYSNPVIVTLNGTADTGYNIANTYYKLDNGSQQTYSSPVTVSGSGKHTIEYWSVDNTGLEETSHKANAFAINYQHAVINSMTQTGNTMNIQIHLDNIQTYLNFISASTGGNNCNNDTTAAFQVYNATTGALVSSQTEAEGGHCFNADADPGTGNQYLVFPPLQLSTGTYFIHYSGGNFDWITDNFDYTAPVPAHNNPITSSSLSPNPTSPGTGLAFYSDPVTVTLNATADSGYSITNTYYKIDSGSQQTYSSPFVVAGTGKHTIEYWSVDNTNIQEANHEFKGFTINYQHALISTIDQNGISVSVKIHLDNIQPYLNYIRALDDGNNCNNDYTATFEIYNAITGALVSSQNEGGSGGNCVNADADPSTGNQWLGYPPLLLPAGTYFVHYSGGNFDWVTENFVYTPTAKTTINLATQLQEGSYSNPTTITLNSVAAVGTTLTNTFYKIDGGAQQTYNAPFTVSGAGNHTIEYWSVDSDGVVEVHKVQTFSILPKYKISGTVYIDSNQNGVQDNGEAGRSGATIMLDSGQNVTTDANGNYSITNLPSTTYTETLTVPAGYTATTQNPVSVALAADTTENFGIVHVPTPTNSPTPFPTSTPTPANVAPVIGTLTASVSTLQVQSSVTMNASFTDANQSDTHTSLWAWGDGTTSTGNVTETNGAGTVTKSHTYTSSGVYTVTLTVTDDHGAPDSKDYQYITVYDPSNGWSTGDKQYISPQGAVIGNQSATGTADFGFTAKYVNGVLQPVGTKWASINFDAGNIDFTASSYQSLVITNGTKIILRGTGTLNGVSGYSVLISAIDGGNQGTSYIRYQIKNGSGNVAYDTQPSAADTANPTTPVSKGKIQIH